jgi:NAD(P)-dependent dehydrogenase (short-subunit alcohol dehydrogenase family)
LTKVVALETATTSVTCNAICPGWVLTPLVERQIDEIAVSDEINMDAARARLLGDKQPSRQFATGVGEPGWFMRPNTARDADFIRRRMRRGIAAGRPSGQNGFDKSERRPTPLRGG